MDPTSVEGNRARVADASIDPIDLDRPDGTTSLRAVQSRLEADDSVFLISERVTAERG